MNTKQQYGQWVVEKELKTNRVYMVSHPEKEGTFILKKASATGGQKGPSTVIGEVKALKLISDHPNIISLVDYSLEPDNPWHVTEYCSGGHLNNVNFQEWSDEELSGNSVSQKLQDLLKAFGYIHSKGILLGGDVEIILSAAKDFVICDIEQCQIWDTHHLDTRDDLSLIMGLCTQIQQKINNTRQARQQAKISREMVQRTLEQAQPSAPRRLATK